MEILSSILIFASLCLAGLAVASAMSPNAARTRLAKLRNTPLDADATVEDDKDAGMISIGDLNRAEHDEQERTIQFLEQYISVS